MHAEPPGLAPRDERLDGIAADSTPSHAAAPETQRVAAAEKAEQQRQTAPAVPVDMLEPGSACEAVVVGNTVALVEVPA